MSTWLETMASRQVGQRQKLDRHRTFHEACAKYADVVDLDFGLRC